MSARDPRDPGPMVRAMEAAGQAVLMTLGALLWLVVEIGIPLGILFAVVYFAVRAAS